MPIDELYPEEPIVIIESLGAVIERLQPEMLKTLGDIATSGADAASLEWTNRLNDASERVFQALDQIFSAINETPTPSTAPQQPKPTKETVVDKEDNDVVVSETTLLIIQHAAQTSEFTLEALRKIHPSLAALPSKDFRTQRSLIIDKLRSVGIETTWEVSGATRGTAYSLRVESGREVFDRMVGETLSPADKDVSQAEQSPSVLESTKQQSETIVDPEQKVGSHESQVVEDTYWDRIEPIIASFPEVRTGRIIQELFGVSRVEPSLFNTIRNELSARVRSGELILCGPELFRHPQPAHVEKWATEHQTNGTNGSHKKDDYSLEQMLAAITPVSQMRFKPRQRGRWRG